VFRGAFLPFALVARFAYLLAPRATTAASMDFEIQRCTRRCAASGRELAPGEAYFSVLRRQGAELARADYAAAAWRGPPDDCVGWWKSRMPDRDAGRAKLAPNDVLLELFRQLEAVPEKQDLRFVLALLLVRRRVLQVEEPPVVDAKIMVLYCPRDESTYRVESSMPSDERIEQIQEELARLLYPENIQRREA
jgi:hypothetical protein